MNSLVKVYRAGPGGVDTVRMSESDPAPTRAATIGGRLVEVIGWIVVVLSAGLIVTQVVLGSVSIAGIVLSLFVAVAGVAIVSIGRAVERSRER